MWLMALPSSLHISRAAQADLCNPPFYLIYAKLIAVSKITNHSYILHLAALLISQHMRARRSLKYPFNKIMVQNIVTAKARL